MIVRYFGQNCFLFYSKKGSRIITDPFSEKLGYFLPPLSCEIVVISHEHQNHIAVWRLLGKPYVAERTNTGACEFEFQLPLTEESFIFRGIPTYHDEFHGRRRGPNTVFVWEMDNLRICHLGDLGHTLTQNQVETIGNIEILLLPVGGGDRILNPKNASLVAQALNPKIIFPMHYKTPYIDVELEPLGSFLKLMPKVQSVDSNQYEISDLPDASTVIELSLPQGRKIGI